MRPPSDSTRRRANASDTSPQKTAEPAFEPIQASPSAAQRIRCPAPVAGVASTRKTRSIGSVMAAVEERIFKLPRRRLSGRLLPNMAIKLGDRGVRVEERDNLRGREVQPLA